LRQPPVSAHEKTYFIFDWRAPIPAFCVKHLYDFCLVLSFAAKGWPLWKASALSWLIAFFEYCLMVPASRYGFANGFSGYQLKMIQEVITLVVFCVSAILVLKEPPQYRYFISFAFLLGAVYFMFKK
jgi:uncharacterized protein